MRLERVTPESQGVRSADILSFIEKVNEEKHELHSFMLIKNGKVLSECWWKPYGWQYRHQMYSLSKSFTSTAIGMAVDEGLLRTDTLVSEIFTEEVKELGNHIDEKMKSMTVKHLLTMGTGMEYENWVWDDAKSNNIIGFLSSHIKNQPGSKFFYHTLATYMQSAIITKLTGQKLVDYLIPRLFEPLGIDPIWEEDKLGNSFGGFGLNIRTEDIGIFGQFLLQKGKWNGKQLVSEAWIDEATCKQIDNGNGESDWGCGYGYQFWMCKPEGVFRGDGMFGQYCIVMPKLNSVLAITSNADMGKLMDLIWERLLPVLGNESPLPENQDYQKLCTYCDTLSHLYVNENAEAYPKFRASYIACSPDSEYKFFPFKKLSFEFDQDECILSLYKNSADNVNASFTYYFKNKAWTNAVSPFISENGSFIFGGESHKRITCYGEWKENSFSICLWYYETPLNIKCSINFNPDKTELEMRFDIFNIDNSVRIAYKRR